MAYPKRRILCVLTSQQVSADTLRSFAEACFRFTPQIALGEGAVFLEVGKCRLLFSEEGLRARVERLAHRFELRVVLGFGDGVGEALARARHGEGALPLYALREYAAPFGGDVDVSALVEKLSMLGFRGLEDFRKLPAAGLAARFGELASLLSAKVNSVYEDAWPEFRPVELVCESAPVEDDVSVESLVFILRGLCDRALARLWGRCERVSVVEVRFDLAKWSTLTSHERVWRIELPLPQGTSRGLIPIVQEHLMADMALGAPVVRVYFSVVEAVPGNGAQRDFFNRVEQEKEAWDALVGRLSYKLGNDRVFVALPVERHLPEKAWARQLEFVKSADDEFPPRWPERPARLLRMPEVLRRAGEYLVHSSGKRWRVLRWEGPERLSGEWWRDPKFEGFFRDYYRVIAEGGEILWVYLNRMNKALYLHGYFD